MHDEGFETIVVGYDGSSESRDALALAALLVEPLGRVYPACVGAGGHVPAADPGALPAGVQLESRAITAGSAARGLHTLAEEIGADLIVLGSTRRGTLGRVLLGTTAETLLHSAPCAVAVPPRGFADDPPDHLRIIGVGYDGSPEADLALAAAEALSRRGEAALRVVAVALAQGAVVPGFSYGYGEAMAGVAEEQAADRLETALDRLRPETRPLAIRRRGDPATVLADEAERGMDALVVGSRGYGPMRRALLGGVSAKLMRFAPCPVLVVPRGAPAAAVAGASADAARDRS